MRRLCGILGICVAEARGNGFIVSAYRATTKHWFVVDRFRKISSKPRRLCPDVLQRSRHIVGIGSSCRQPSQSHNDRLLK